MYVYDLYTVIYILNSVVIYCHKLKMLFIVSSYLKFIEYKYDDTFIPIH